MPFMLGSFLNGSQDAHGGFHGGLFGGASDVFSLASNYVKLRDALDQRDTANTIKNAMQRGAQDSTGGIGGLYGPDATSGSSTDTSRPDYETFDDDPELSKLPKLVKTALKSFTSSPSEGKGVYGRGQSTADYNSSPREGRNYGGAPADAQPAQAALGGLTDAVGGAVSGAYDAGKRLGSNGLDWLESLGERIHAFARGYNQQPQQPPAYLPPTKPPNVGPAGAGGGAGPGTLDMLQQHSALPVGSPGMPYTVAGVPYPNGPTLANQQDPRARIIAALTIPTAGSTI